MKRRKPIDAHAQGSGHPDKSSKIVHEGQPLNKSISYMNMSGFPENQGGPMCGPGRWIEAAGVFFFCVAIWEMAGWLGRLLLEWVR